MFEPTVREEVHIVREVLEGAFSPQLATQVMFEALQQSGAVPGSTEEVLHFCRPPQRRCLHNVPVIAYHVQARRRLSAQLFGVLYG